MTRKITVYTDDLGKFLWHDGKLLEVRRTPNELEGFVIPITIDKEEIVWEFDEDIMDVKKTVTE